MADMADTTEVEPVHVYRDYSIDNNNSSNNNNNSSNNNNNSSNNNNNNKKISSRSSNGDNDGETKALLYGWEAIT